MRHSRIVPALLVVATAAVSVTCGNDERPHVPAATGGSGGADGTAGSAGAGGGAGGAPVAPGSAFDRFCIGSPWDGTLSAAAPGELTGAYAGVFVEPPPAHSLETMKVIPAHPFWVRTVRLAFGGQLGGATRIHLMTTFGRSYPGGWPEIDDPSTNLLVPLYVEVPDAPDPESWLEIDVSAEGVFLEPTQHYLIVNEKLGDTPLVAVEELTGESSRAMLHLPDEFEAYGLDGNFRMELRGQYFCAWSEPERQFGLRTDGAFADLPSGDVSVTDLDGDGHDDVVAYLPGPTALFGDGAGAFAAPDGGPFAEVAEASFLVFADLDNDGDRDAFAMKYVTVDGDGDGFALAEGDCNDADAAIRPGKAELDNGQDDDCDGVADDGSDTTDADQDGTSIAAGDCDDTRGLVHPGAPELLDALDNDCDGQTDEESVSRIALNDGLGHFSAVAAAGVETVAPSTTAGFGDGNGDGVLDLYWGNWLEHYPDFRAVQDRYVVGNGDGTFVDATEAAGLLVSPVRPCYGVAWNDFDNDGRQDIFVGNYQLSDNYLWQNQGDGTFLDVAAAVQVDHDGVPPPNGYDDYPGGHSYGATFGDIDFDGDMDFFLANLSHPRTQPWADPSMLYLNGGAPDFLFEDRRAALGIIYDEGDINAAFADFDNDLDLDLVVVAVYPTHYLKLYRNDGAAGFVDVTYEAGIEVESAGRVAWADLDEDGDLDLLVPGSYGPPFLRFYENRIGQSSGWVELELEGTSSNRDAVGARVSLAARGVTQLREVRAGEAHRQQHSHVVHFGLGDATSIESVEVRWPSGATEIITGVAPRGRYRVVEGEGAAVPLE